jgi:hypothetical protein
VSLNYGRPFDWHNGSKFKLEDCNMKYFGLAAAALMLTVSASAATVVSVTCGSFSFAGTGGSGSWVCPTLSSLDNGGTVTSEEIIYGSDYSNGLSNTMQVQTVFTFSGSTPTNAADTLTSTGGTNSSQATSADLAAFQALNLGPPPTPAGYIDIYSAFANAITVGFNNTYVSGGSLGTTGFAQLVFTYNPAVQTSAPEPGSMMLLGSGLLAAGLIGRKKFARK